MQLTRNYKQFVWIQTHRHSYTHTDTSAVIHVLEKLEHAVYVLKFKCRNSIERRKKMKKQKQETNIKKSLDANSTQYTNHMCERL